MKESKSDLGTLVAIAAFSLILATMLHEHGGHALACFSLGGHLNELGAFYEVQPEWLIRLGLVGSGLAAYAGVVLFSVRKMDTFIGGEKQERVNRAQLLSLIAWLAGAVAGVLIGFLNPRGIIIVLVSSVASCVAWAY